ncbi:TMEM175 family protein [Cryobacterium sp. BB736]|uniref:TMEM175 family protein n=1 Tax=Cryobacterium sp. BB736 TaxID=2746963 RepID=UPI0018773869|nr:TMEM175 family protein [Cryobacterium sp. BB736]
MNRDDAERMQRFRLRAGRMEAFSDGVFAIATTLLVLEISVSAAADADLFGAIVDEWPSYLAYLVSFSTIGAIWIGHAYLSEVLREVSPGFLRLNLLLLLFVAFLPFPTRLLADNLGMENAERVAVTLYGAVLLATSGCLWMLWRFALKDDLVRTDRDEADLRFVGRKLTPGLAFYVGLIVVGLFFPIVAVFGYFLVAISLLLPRRRTRARDT